MGQVFEAIGHQKKFFEKNKKVFQDMVYGDFVSRNSGLYSLSFYGATENSPELFTFFDEIGRNSYLHILRHY